MKFFGVIALLSFATLAVILGNSNASNSTFGYIGPYDILLLRENVYKPSSWLRIVSTDVVFPRGYYNPYFITGIRAIDRDRKGGGHASLLRGGPGARNVTIHLKSERSNGLNFTIEIFGRH